MTYALMNLIVVAWLVLANFHGPPSAHNLPMFVEGNFIKVFIGKLQEIFFFFLHLAFVLSVLTFNLYLDVQFHAEIVTMITLTVKVP